MKEVLAAHGLKMPQLAMPLRLLVTGQLQTPAIDAVLELFGRETVLARLQKVCNYFCWLFAKCKCLRYNARTSALTGV
jgi:glutamyl/glutaminyl-tRNA synthetase